VFGGFYGSLLSDDVKGNATARSVSIVVLKNDYEGGRGTEGGPDMVEMTEHMEELALALGAAAPETVARDKAALCSTAASFRSVAERAHAAGVRSMAAFMPYLDQPPEIAGAFLPNPDRDPVLSLLQNLGLRILSNEHAGDYW